MTRHKGVLRDGAIDRGWPHQVALLDDECIGKRYEELRAFCKPLSVSPRGRSVVAVGPGHFVGTFQLFCFSDPTDAELFRSAFGGEFFNPARDRGKGTKRDRWFRD